MLGKLANHIPADEYPPRSVELATDLDDLLDPVPTLSAQYLALTESVLAATGLAVALVVRRRRRTQLASRGAEVS
jgi:hypothetical protein